MEKHSLSFDILFLGESMVGKTAFIKRYTEGFFSEAAIATYVNGNTFDSKRIIRNDQKIHLKIHDTAGQERYHSISEGLYKRCQGIVLMYDITSDNSFKRIAHWMGNITEKCKESELAIALLGNKCDLEKLRKVSKEEGQNIANEKGLIFFEASVKDNINIDLIMETLSDKLIEKAVIEKKNGIKLEETKKSQSSCCSGGETPKSKLISV